jgi:hypothetical protein
VQLGVRQRDLDLDATKVPLMGGKASQVDGDSAILQLTVAAHELGWQGAE